MFADKYLEKQNREALISGAPDRQLGISVVIPCYREPDILQTLNSLNTCKQPKCKTEVIILINNSETDPVEIKKYNKATKIEIEKWIKKNSNQNINWFATCPINFPKKRAGAGLARKSGMDEAVRRFNELNRPKGIIVSLDADTLVAENYLTEIENHFKQNPKDAGATISFEHRTDGLEERQLTGIKFYEKYLDYYKRALEFTGYPYSMFTVGSAFAVTAEAYVKRGGMNRRQAGEDFYFLQNLVQVGNVGEITRTKVYPSARLSDRVPFGTGPILQKWMNGEEDLTLTYNFRAFTDLKQFFDIKEKLFGADEKEFDSVISELPETVSTFIETDGFRKEIDDLNKNCSTITTFSSRFFHKFNAFKILKYLNFVHDNFYKKADINKQLENLENLLTDNFKTKNL